MRRPPFGLGSLTLLAAVFLAIPASAQTASVAARPVGPFAYDVTKETTINGTVSSVLSKPAAGMILGAHLLVTTSSGTVDASLGMFPFAGKGALSVQEGNWVAVTGVMKTINGKEVFLVRTVKVGNEIYPIRDERGAIITPQERESGIQASAEKGLWR